MLLLLVLPALAMAASPNSRIVGGSDVDIANYQFQGSYRTATGSHTCGCIFFGGQWAVTAGHCGGSTAHTMEFGNTNRGSGPYAAIAVVTRHPDYDNHPDGGFTSNDFSVVQATADISGDNIAAGELAPNGDNPGGDGWITGWGRTCGSCALPITLQGTEIPIISDAECTNRWGSNNFNPAVMICVMDIVNQDIGSCNGDSGGPLSVGNTIYGVTSWGASGCLTSYPSAYAKIGAVRDWVCETSSGGINGC